jgi:hypothetical protein
MHTSRQMAVAVNGLAPIRFRRPRKFQGAAVPAWFAGRGVSAGSSTHGPQRVRALVASDSMTR